MLDDLEKKINYFFKNKDLLKKAFIHPSYVNEHKKDNLTDNQRLEFLGDAVVELVVSNYLYNNFIDYDEGMLTKTRIKIVCEQTLSAVAKKLDLYKYLICGNGENIEKVKHNNSVLCDTYEAHIAAVYIDGGLTEVTKVLNKTLLIDDIINSIDTDYKSILYEYASKEKIDIQYKVEDEIGPDHNKKFVIALYLNNKLVSRGIGSSKKNAEQEAAKKQIDKLDLGVN